MHGKNANSESADDKMSESLATTLRMENSPAKPKLHRYCFESMQDVRLL